MIIIRNTHYIAFTLVNTRHIADYAIFMLIDMAYTLHYVIFSGGEYYLYHVLLSIFGGRILFILCTTEYFRKSILKGTGAY